MVLWVPINTTTIDFGPFPGSASARTEIDLSATEYDPNATIDVWIAPVDTSDHTADEHAADPPLVSAEVRDGKIVIQAFASGRDKPIPDGTPFGNTANSQRPIGNQQPMPYGVWTVGWALSPTAESSVA